MRFCCLLLAILGLVGMGAHADEPSFQISKEMILDAWKKNAQIDSSILDGVEYTAEFSGGKKTQVALDSQSLIIKGETGLVIYDQGEVHALSRIKTRKDDPFQFLKLTRNGKEYEYFGKITHQNHAEENGGLSHPERIRKMQEYLGDTTTCFPFVAPEAFHAFGKELVGNPSLPLQSPFVQVESITRQTGGMVRLVYVENHPDGAGFHRAWQRVTMTLDPSRNYQVVQEDWVSLDPVWKRKGSRRFTYGPMFANGPIVLRECRDEEQFQDHPSCPAGKVTFSQFRKSKLGPDRLKVSNYERDLPHDYWQELPMHCGCCVWRRPAWLEEP